MNSVASFASAGTSVERIVGRPVELACSHCGDGLDLHQPSIEQSAHLLGVCVGCGQWHLVELDDRSATRTIAAIPCQQLLTRARSARRGAQRKTS